MNTKRMIAGGILTLGLTLGGTSAALAETTYPPEGGTWNYGVVSGVHLYSDYFHQTQCHGSSTRNDFGLSSSPEVIGGVWSNNSQGTTPNQNNRAYYRTC
jgi:lactococcin 972 family bacteriocin